MEASTVRVLVVDDYEPFRRFVCSTLDQRPDLQVIGEASDGLEAVRKAEELKPDLIVLDIGLPSLNGIEVARRIRKLCPECKIVFVSQESSADVAQEAFSLGAMGYVVKAHAGSELLAALEEVCQGRQFVSRGLSDHTWASAADAQAPDQLLRQEILPSLASGKAEIVRSHEVQFYSDDESFLDGFTRYIEVALLNGNATFMGSPGPGTYLFVEYLTGSENFELLSPPSGDQSGTFDEFGLWGYLAAPPAPSQQRAHSLASRLMTTRTLGALVQYGLS